MIWELKFSTVRSSQKIIQTVKAHRDVSKRKRAGKLKRKVFKITFMPGPLERDCVSNNSTTFLCRKKWEGKREG